MRNLGKYVKKYGILYVVAIAAMVVSILLDAASPQITRHIIDDVIVGGKMEMLMRLLLGLLGIGLGRAIFQYMKEFIFDYSASGIGSSLRKDLFDHIQTLSMGYFDSHNTGELMARVKDDVDRIWNAMGFVGMLIIECTIHMTCMFRLSPVLTVIPLLVMPVIAWYGLKMENGLGQVYDKISEQTAELNTVAQENLAGVRTVKAFAREDYEIDRFKRHNKRYYDLNMEQAKLIVKYQPNVSFLSKVMLMAIIVAGGIMVIQKRITIENWAHFRSTPTILSGRWRWLDGSAMILLRPWLPIRRSNGSWPRSRTSRNRRRLWFLKRSRESFSSSMWILIYTVRGF